MDRISTRARTSRPSSPDLRDVAALRIYVALAGGARRRRRHVGRAAGPAARRSAFYRPGHLGRGGSNVTIRVDRAARQPAQPLRPAAAPPAARAARREYLRDVYAQAGRVGARRRPRARPDRRAPGAARRPPQADGDDDDRARHGPSTWSAAIRCYRRRPAASAPGLVLRAELEPAHPGRPARRDPPRRRRRVVAAGRRTTTAHAGGRRRAPPANRARPRTSAARAARRRRARDRTPARPERRRTAARHRPAAGATAIVDAVPRRVQAALQRSASATRWSAHLPRPPRPARRRGTRRAGRRRRRPAPAPTPSSSPRAAGDEPT